MNKAIFDYEYEIDFIYRAGKNEKHFIKTLLEAIKVNRCERISVSHLCQGCIFILVCAMYKRNEYHMKPQFVDLVGNFGISNTTVLEIA